MNIGETNTIPAAAKPAPTRDIVEPAHVKKQVEQVDTTIKDAVNSSAPPAPGTGKFVDINA